MFLTCWLVLCGISTAPLPFECAAPTGLTEAQVVDVLRDGKLIGCAVRHGARVHGVLHAGAESGMVSLRESKEPRAAIEVRSHAGKFVCGQTSLANSGTVEHRGLHGELIPAVAASSASEVVHECAALVELGGAGLAADGALHWTWTLECDGEEWLLWSMRAHALRALTLEDGLGLELSGVPWPFAGEGELLQRTAKGWCNAAQAVVQDTAAVAVGGGAQVAPLSPWHLWFEWAERMDDGRLRLLVLPRGTQLAAGESRIWRARVGPADPQPMAQALLLHSEPKRASTAFEQLVHTQVQSFLGDGVHGLRRFEPDAGDWMHNAFAVGNVEYDTIGGLLEHGMHAGDVSCVSAALAARDHLLSVDFDPARGFPFEHGRVHRSGHHEAGHHWVAGLLAAGRAHPDSLTDAALDAMLQTQEKEFESFDPERERERSAGWGLLALAETRRARVLGARGVRALARISRLELSRPWGSGWVAPVVLPADERRIVLDSFEQAIHLVALHASAKATESSAAAARAQRLATRLAEDALIADEQGRMHVAESIAVERSTGRTACVQGQQRVAKALFVLAAVRHCLGARTPARLQTVEDGLVSRFAAQARKFTGEETALLLFAERLLHSR
jgi:hypothetical protein